MLFRMCMLSAALVLAGCSAIQLYQENTGATQAAATAINATVAAVIEDASDQQDALEATVAALYAASTRAAQSLGVAQATADAALATATPDPLAPALAADAGFSAAEISVFGQAPVDSERLNTIAALAFDGEGQLLVGMRAGEIYRLVDADGDGIAEGNQLVFQDESDAIGQVSGLLMVGGALLLVHDGRLHSLVDGDGDGFYERAALLSSALPPNQNPLRANNSLARSPDGALFTADVLSGTIFRIIPQ